MKHNWPDEHIWDLMDVPVLEDLDGNNESISSAVYRNKYDNNVLLAMAEKVYFSKRY